ncbi:MAG: TonB-dependent receptor domain-containing protein [Flavobacteriales bacterium]
MNLFRLLTQFCCVLFPCCMIGQTVKGRVVDATNGVPVFSAVVGEKGTTNGITTDFDGEFSLKVSKIPTTLVISIIGFTTQELEVTSDAKRLDIKMVLTDVSTSEVEIVSDRMLEKQKQNPLTVETMDAIAIKDAASGSFYESLGTLKGVDMTSASLGFRIINTRGFNSTSPVRTLQLIDGVDNQSPGLNFSLGNFLGACDLDVKKVEIVQGASSSFYGPGAFNGVVNMETKDPWFFQGLSAQLRVGERSLFEPQIRWAESIKNKNEKEFFAYKLCAFYMSAMDWEARNFDPIYNSDNDANNPGRYDAVNIYGDEYFPGMDLSDATPWTYRGIGTFYRTGYKEEDVLDYDTENLKANLSLHFRLKPELDYQSPELILANNVGTGTTVYQGDNRFRLQDIFFMQNRIEFRKKDSYFIRVYSTREDAGKSYDPYATSLKMQEEARSDEDWSKVYIRYWQDSINSRINGTGYPGLVPNPDYDGTNNLWLPYDYEGQSEWLEEYQDSLMNWHSLVEGWTNNGNAGLVGIDSTGFFLPGSDDFNEAFNRLIALKNNVGEGGTLFYDKSSLYHAHAEKQYSFKKLDEWVFGANARLYAPNSDGTIFSDTASRRIRNFEFGVYTGIEKKLLEDKLILSATIRMDKNQNFDAVFSPAASAVYSPKKNHYARLSFSSALRNPTLADQYLYLNVGPATLSGNLSGADSLVTLDSWGDFRSSLDRDDLSYFNIDPIRPEQVRTIEAGYRAGLTDRLYVDGGYYFSSYTHFIGYLIGLDIEFNNTLTGLPSDVNAFRYAANSKTTVQTQGLNVGANYFLGQYMTLSANYSWNKLVKTDESDPIIPAFNTPEHKYNLGISGRGIKFKKNTANEFGFGVNYKWIKGFIFEGSPQFTGFVPSYDLVDAQINYLLKKSHCTFKLGGSNLLNNKSIQTYGGPEIGRLAYASILFEL